VPRLLRPHRAATARDFSGLITAVLRIKTAGFSTWKARATHTDGIHGFSQLHFQLLSQMDNAYTFCKEMGEKKHPTMLIQNPVKLGHSSKITFNHRIIECFELEGTFNIIQFQPPAIGRDISL